MNNSQYNTKPTVLLVNATPDTRIIVGKILDNAGINTVSVKDTLDDTLANMPINLALIDLDKSADKGYEALKTIRQNNKSIPVIAHTAHVYTETRGKCLEAGFDDYISKPILPFSSLHDTVMKYLK